MNLPDRVPQGSSSPEETGLRPSPGAAGPKSEGRFG